MNKTKGFTLVELLVAIAIFAVLSALGWKTFDYINKVKERNTVKEAQLDHIQTAYQQILKDMTQVIPVSANINNEIKPALNLQNGRLAFTKTGVTDPLLQGLSSVERIEYVFNVEAKTLERLRYKNINQLAGDQPDSSTLLENITSFNMVVLNPNEISQWAPSAGEDKNQIKQLPRGMKIKFTYEENEYEWTFSLLNTDYLNKKKQNNDSSN